MSSDPAEKVYSLLQTFHTAMLITHTAEDTMHARPMEIAKADAECHLWFFTDGTSPKSHEIRQDQQVLVTFQKDHQKYLSLTGLAQLVTDRSTIGSLWQEDYRVWFPNGVDDPNLTLVHVIPQFAEFWDNSGTQGIKYLYEATKAYLTRTTPDIDEGDQHGRVPLG